MADAKWVKDLENLLNQLKADINKFKEETSINLSNLSDHIVRKADKEELPLFEQKIMERINDMIRKLMGQFADKNDTRKRLANLEKNVRIQ